MSIDRPTLASDFEKAATLARGLSTPLGAVDRGVGAALEAGAGLFDVAAELVRGGVDDPVAHMRRALDIHDRVAELEAAGEHALVARFRGTPSTHVGDTEPPPAGDL